MHYNNHHARTFVPTLVPVVAETEARGSRPASAMHRPLCTPRSWPQLPLLYEEEVLTLAEDGAQRSVLGMHGWDGFGHVRCGLHGHGHMYELEKLRKGNSRTLSAPGLLRVSCSLFFSSAC